MSQQNAPTSATTSSGGPPGRLAQPNYRSDSTKPSPRPSSASRSAIGSGSLTRQGSSGHLAAGGVRAGGRASLGASGSLSGRPSLAQGGGGGGAAGANAAASVLSGAAAAAAADNTSGAAALSATRKAVAVAAAPAATATTTAAAAGGAGGDSQLTPVPPQGPRPVFISNKLYGDEVPGFTPTVNTKGYTPKLSPHMDELQQKWQQAESQGLAAAEGGTTAAAAAAVHAGPEALAPGHAAAAAVAIARASNSKPPAPQHFLRTTGDLFCVPDQDVCKEPLVVNLSQQTQLVSPAWNQARPWLSGTWLMEAPAAFLQEAGGAPDQQQLAALVDLRSVPAAEAEALLVDDLLTVMMGQAGQYIKHSLVDGAPYSRLGLWVQGVTDPSLQEQVERLLPLCEYVYVIKRFVETRAQIEYPMVLQALAAVMRKLQEEWWVLVVQLEHQYKLGQLNLASLLYYCQAPSASLALLADIAGEAASMSSLTSAGLLNLLVFRQRSLAGDRAGQQLVGQLLEAAAEPYFGILRQWLCSGVLDDPYKEFMVKEDAAVQQQSLTPEGDAAYWSLRYTIRRGFTEGVEFDVPVFLESSMDAILVTGKYLNVIRECGQQVPPCPDTTLTQLRFDAAAAERGSPPFLAGIQAALSAAAGALLAHMTGPQGRMLCWLHCLKHFFLLDQGDFLVHLMEQGDAESPAPLHSLAPHQLQGLLDAALRSSSVAASPHVDVVTDGALVIKVDKRSILQLVTAATVSTAQQESTSLRAAGVSAGHGAGGAGGGWEDLMLGLNLSWPLNLVVGKRQLLHYQVIFKQLLSLKHAEKQLGYVWQALRATKRLSKQDQARFRPWHLLCSQLLHVVCEVLRYTTIDVLEPLWADMFSRLNQAGNMDEVIQLHNAFLHAALERSLLLQADVVRHIHNLLAVAKELSKVVESCDVQQTGLSSGGGSSSSGGAGLFRKGSAAQHHLQVLSMFCRQVTRQEQLGQLQSKVRKELELLLLGLQSHYKLVSQAPLAPVAAAGGSFRAAAGGSGSSGGRPMRGQWRWVDSVAALGDSSRELASLHNLIERLKLGEPGIEALML